MTKDLLQEQIQIAVVSGTSFGGCKWCNEFVNHDDGTLRCSSFILRKGSRGDGHQLVPEFQDVVLLQSETEEFGKLLDPRNAFRFGLGFQARTGVRQGLLDGRAERFIRLGLHCYDHGTIVVATG